MAENNDHIDQLIRQKFENFEPEPPVAVWESIRTKISDAPPPSSPGIILPVIIAISILVFLSGLLHHFNGSNNLPPAGISESGKTLIQSAGTVSTGSTTITDASLQESAYNTTQQQVISREASTIKSMENEPAKSTIPVRAPFDRKEPAKKNKDKKMEERPEQVTAAQRPIGAWKPGLRQALEAGPVSYADARKYDLSARDINKLSRYSEQKKNTPVNWSLGILFHPEVTTFTHENTTFGSTFSLGLSILPQVTFNRFFIQSGVNYRNTYDKGNNEIEYNRFLGTYQEVYLVTFDSTENGVIPTYYTHTVDVYDTVDHYSVSETRARYAYLEVPLLLGYRFTTGKFSLYAKAGPAASFLVYKNIPETGTPEEGARIVNVSAQIPVRSTINWQAQFGAGFDYQLNGKVSLNLEPTLRLALKPEYQSPAGSPLPSVSYGVRAGLKYHF
jgi:hypothetical protein